MVRLVSVLCLLYCGAASANAPLRLDLLSSPAGAFGYYYNVGSTVRAGDRVTGIRLPNLASITNRFDSLGRFEYTALRDQWSHVLDGYKYTHDSLGLRTNIVRELGVATNSVRLGYDAIGQLTSWRASESSGTPRQHEQLAWVYDLAGNLRFRTNNALVQTFTTDPANQLTNVTRTGTLTVSGSLSAPMTNVTVNGSTADRYADLTFARTNLVVSTGATSFTNVAQNAYGAGTTNTLTVTLPQSVTLQYDLNGNLTNDDTRSFVYDAENQLTAVYVTGQWKAEFVYDGLGRRRIMRECGPNFGAPTNEVRFVYDGMLIVQERDAANTPKVTYTRGLDLSGGLQGAGGIGGLLARTEASGSAFYHADGAGNITALIDYQQNVAARYAYGPFGNLLGKWGPLADANPMRFSSMPQHANSALTLYAFRAYSSSLQRWIQRDPIGEFGGVNLYGFVGNSPINEEDPFGLTNQPGDFGWGMYSATLPPGSRFIPPSPRPPPTFVGPSTGNSIPYDSGRSSNPFTYDALLLGANDLVDTPVGIQLAEGNAFNYMAAPGTEMIVGPLLSKLSPLLKQLLKTKCIPKTPLGDLTPEEIKVIQKAVDETGTPLTVVGSAARGERTAASDIDYLIPMPEFPSTMSGADQIVPRLPGFDGRLIRGTFNPYEGPGISFTPGNPPVMVPGVR